MSGTSVDGIDAVLVKSDGYGGEVVSHVFSTFSGGLDRELLSLQQNPGCDLKTLGQLDHRLSCCYADTVSLLLNKAGIEAAQVVAIGSHGQTIFHDPQGEYPFTMQIGDPNLLAEKTGIPVVSDFRRMDVACGGGGAPLSPVLHQALFSSEDEVRVVVNFGGISNMTVLHPNKPVIGFDTGPANCLMDYWIQYHQPGLSFDDKGAWAASGTIDVNLLDEMMSDAYFKLPPPKSTGKELFSMQWLRDHVGSYPNLAPVDVQATLCELTAATVAQDIMQYVPEVSGVYVCGGGAHNDHLMQRLSSLLSNKKVVSTDMLGMPVEHVEAAAFAWLAQCRIEKISGNIPSVTGAKKAAVLGGLYLPPI